MKQFQKQLIDMSSVRSIAKAAGVSPATVSRVINNDPRVTAEVREKVLALANESRYVPQVGRKSTTNIAFAYTGESSLGSPFDAALMQGIADRMEAFGFDLLILDASMSRLPHETFTQMFMRKGVRGAVLRTTSRGREVCRQIAAEGFPVVVMGDRFDDPAISFIYSDSRDTSREAIEHLLQLGHRKIAISLNVVDDTDHMDRLAGYHEALNAAGVQPDEDLVIRVPARRDGGVQLMRRLMAMADRPTAIYITDPLPAAGAMGEASRIGLRIPEDLSIVGFDDAELRFIVHPPLTAVCQDATSLGRAAFSTLCEMMNQKGSVAATRTKLGTQFEIHGSTASPGQPAYSADVSPSHR